MTIATLLVLTQIAIPPATGYVNDFAGVHDPSAGQHMETVIAEVRDKTRADMELGVDAVAQAFAEGLGVTLTGSRPPPEEAEPAPSRVPVAYILALVLLLLLTRGRLLWLPFWLGGFGGWRSGRGGWSSGWGGGGGGFSGGFGGFGGGGGFSGGGAGGRF